MPVTDQLAFVRKGLKQHRGKWEQISRESKVPYFTLSKISSGKSSDPRYSSIKRLAEWIDRNGSSEKQRASA